MMDVSSKQTEPHGQDATEGLLSIVTPAFNEADNLQLLYQRLCSVLDSLSVRWEWIIVDDHSSDATFEVISRIAEADARIKGLRLARNSGSHLSLTCSLHRAEGDCVVALAADLQDPPEVIPELLERWRAGYQVVWAAREKREGESRLTKMSSRLYYMVMRHLLGFKEMSATGADFFLLDRKVVTGVKEFGEHNISLLALLTWMGFRQTTLSYVKQARHSGDSGWTLSKKLKLLVDSVTAFSYLPIRSISYLGFFIALMGFVYAAFVIANALLGIPPEGWSTLIVIVLFLGGVQMIMLGVLGEYIWRGLDEARRRPRFLIESETGRQSKVLKCTNSEAMTDSQESR